MEAITSWGLSYSIINLKNEMAAALEEGKNEQEEGTNEEIFLKSQSTRLHI